MLHRDICAIQVRLGSPVVSDLPLGAKAWEVAGLGLVVVRGVVVVLRRTRYGSIWRGVVVPRVPVSFLARALCERRKRVIFTFHISVY